MSHSKQKALFDMTEYCGTVIYARPGHGKTEVVKYFANEIPYKHLLIISSSSYQYEEYNNKSCTINWDYDIEQVEDFLTKKGVKLIIFDDFLHISFTGAVGQSARKLLSTCRHTHTYILVSCQNLTCMGKTFRMTAKQFLTGSIDKDSIEYLELLTKYSKNELKEYQLDKYVFLVANADGRKPRKFKLSKQVHSNNNIRKTNKNPANDDGVDIQPINDGSDN